MTKNKWKQQIKKCCEEAGTYKPYFDDVIETLAQVLEERDRTYKQYKDTGKRPVIAYTNKAGATNPVKNPILLLWDELNATALSLWRDLGLTPSGLKKLNEDAVKNKVTNPFNDFLRARLDDKQTNIN